MRERRAKGTRVQGGKVLTFLSELLGMVLKPLEAPYKPSRGKAWAKTLSKKRNAMAFEVDLRV